MLEIHGGEEAVLKRVSGTVHVLAATICPTSRLFQPPVDPGFDTTLADACYALAKRWDEARDREHLDFTSEDLANFMAGQKSEFQP